MNAKITSRRNLPRALMPLTTMLAIALLVASCGKKNPEYTKFGAIKCEVSKAFEIGVNMAHKNQNPQIFYDFAEKCQKAGFHLSKQQFSQGYQNGLSRICTSNIAVIQFLNNLKYHKYCQAFGFNNYQAAIVAAKHSLAYNEKIKQIGKQIKTIRNKKNPDDTTENLQKKNQLINQLTKYIYQLKTEQNEILTQARNLDQFNQ